MIRQLLGRTKTLSKSVSRVDYDALDLLRSDHMKVEAMLVQLRLGRNPAHRRKLFREIKQALEQHMEIEETIFYPACSKLPGMKAKMEHARSEHQLVKAVIEDLEVIGADTRRYDSLVTKLIIKLEHHVQEEEGEIFKNVRRKMSKSDFARMSDAMLAEHSGTRTPMRRAA